MTRSTTPIDPAKKIPAPDPPANHSTPLQIQIDDILKSKLRPAFLSVIRSFTTALKKLKSAK